MVRTLKVSVSSFGFWALDWKTINGWILIRMNTVVVCIFNWPWEWISKLSCPIKTVPDLKGVESGLLGNINFFQLSIRQQNERQRFYDCQQNVSQNGDNCWHLLTIQFRWHLFARMYYIGWIPRIFFLVRNPKYRSISRYFTVKRRLAVMLS